MILRLEGLSLCYRDVDLAKAEKHRNKKRKVDDSKGIITVRHTKPEATNPTSQKQMQS